MIASSGSACRQRLHELRRVERHAPRASASSRPHRRRELLALGGAGRDPRPGIVAGAGRQPPLQLRPPSAARVSFGSLTMPRSTGKFLAISYASRSTWTTLRPARRRRERREDLREHVRPDDQDRVAPSRPAARCGGRTCAPVAPEERVGLVDVDLGRVGAPHVRAEQLRDVGQLRLGARHRDPVAHDDQRAPRRPAGPPPDGSVPGPGRPGSRASSRATTGSLFGASRTSAGRHTKTGPVGAVRGDLDRPAQHAQDASPDRRPGSPTWSPAGPSRRGRPAIWASIAS